MNELNKKIKTINRYRVLQELSEIVFIIFIIMMITIVILNIRMEKTYNLMACFIIIGIGILSIFLVHIFDYIVNFYIKDLKSQYTEINPKRPNLYNFVSNDNPYETVFLRGPEIDCFFVVIMIFCDYTIEYKKIGKTDFDKLFDLDNTIELAEK